MIASRFAAVGAAAALWSCGALAPLDHAIDDIRFALCRRPASGTLLAVDIDAASLTGERRWPWDRRVYADIVDRLTAAGAEAAAFDVDLSAPGSEAGDAALEAALKRADGSTILAALIEPAGAAGGEIVRTAEPRFAAASWPGLVNQGNRYHGQVRDMLRFEGRASPGAAGALQELPGLSTALVAPPPSRDPTFTVDYGIDAGGIDQVSAADLLAGRVDPARIAGRKVLVGATAPELGDFVSVPRYGLVPGVMLHALAAESLIQGRALRPLHPGLVLGACGLLLLGAVLTARRRRLPGHLLVLAGAAALGEAAAALLQAAAPLQPSTAPLHVALLFLALSAVAAEVGDRRVRILRARAEADRLRAILDRVVADNFAGIVVVDHDGAVRAVSAAAAAILGLPPGIDGEHFDAMLPGPLAAACAEALAEDEGRRRPAREVECAVRDGTRAVLEIVATPSRVPGPVGDRGRAGPERRAVCLSFADVTEKRAAEARLLGLARVDALTGLANRRMLVEAIEAALAGPDGGGAAGLLFFDLDRFKVVNDRLGHAAGDALLCAVADRLRTRLGPGDLAARLGGDEFAVLARRPTVDDLRGLGDGMVAALGGVHALGPYEAEVGLSLGLALAADAGDARALMRNADAAMAAARRAGGGAVALFDAAMERVAEDEKALEQDMRDGLRRGEFLVHYQRQVDLRSGRIVGVEALVRWRHPERGLVSPGAFIPIAERTGLIEAIGAFVLRTACRDAAGWPESIKVSVNLSAVQLQRGDLLATVFGALAEAGLPAARLDLELTESLLMGNDGAARERLDRLREAGVQLSLDDFGTGYSSLSYLRSFPVNKLKIDQSFVRGLPGDETAAAIISAVVSLAGRLGIRVNAEGAEALDQVEALCALGCDEVQGWFHGRPGPAEAIAASLMAQRDGVTLAVSGRALAA